MAELKDLLTRDDIKGGEIQEVLNGVGVFRSDIIDVEMSGGTVHFKSTTTFKEEPARLEVGSSTTWEVTKKKSHYYPADTKIVGSNNNRPQFDIVDAKGHVIGWAIIFPSKDNFLVLHK